MNGNRKGMAVKEQVTDDLQRIRTTIGLKKDTKDRLDQNRAPGQCYNGFICQLVDLWEKVKENKPDYVLNISRGGDA